MAKTKVIRVEADKDNLITTTTFVRTTLSPEAQKAWKKFKFEVASELDIDYRLGYNGHLTQQECSRLGGEITRRCVLEGKINIIKRYME